MFALDRIKFNVFRFQLDSLFIIIIIIRNAIDDDVDEGFQCEEAVHRPLSNAQGVRIRDLAIFVTSEGT